MGQAVPIEMGKSGPHKIFVTYGTPQTLAGAECKNVLATPERLRRAIEYYAKAFDNAKKESGVDEPKPQRIMYEAVQLHKFDGKPPWA
jgi:hypothetical protein